jgi:hypothetical protein
MMKFYVALIFISLAAFLTAQEPSISDTLVIQGFYSFDQNEGWGQKGGFIPPSYSPIKKDPAMLTSPDLGRDLGSGWGGVGLEALWKRKIRFPFLQGDAPLTQGNSLDVNLNLGLSPVTLKLEAELVLTPIAFLQFGLGGMAGSGWNAVLFNGLGLNTQPSGEIEKTPFGGLVLKTWGFGLFQFDLGALVPGEWTHVLLLSRGTLSYQYFTGANQNQAWQWAADEGRNFNAPKLESTHFIGYQMPLVLNTVGILFETSIYLDPVFSLSRLNDGGWGSDFMSLTVNLLTNWTLGDKSSLAVLLGVKNFVDVNDATIFNRYYQHWSAEAVGWKLDRLSFQWSLRL